MSLTALNLFSLYYNFTNYICSCFPAILIFETGTDGNGGNNYDQEIDTTSTTTTNTNANPNPTTSTTQSKALNDHGKLYCNENKETTNVSTVASSDFSSSSSSNAAAAVQELNEIDEYETEGILYVDHMLISKLELRVSVGSGSNEIRNENDNKNNPFLNTTSDISKSIRSNVSWNLKIEI